MVLNKNNTNLFRISKLFLVNLKYRIMNIIDRLLSETPVFWKKVRTVAVSTVGAAGAIIALSTQLPIPVEVIEIAKYVVAIAATLGISAQATVKDSGQVAPPPPK
jgi:hypothetical protein